MATIRTQHRPTHASRQRKRLFGVTLTMALAFASASGVVQAAENSPANCTGIAVSSLAGNPGVVAFLTRGFSSNARAPSASVIRPLSIT